MLRTKQWKDEIHPRTSEMVRFPCKYQRINIGVQLFQSGAGFRPSIGKVCAVWAKLSHVSLAHNELTFFDLLVNRFFSG